MYTIDFQSPIHIHFIGIGGISMSGLAEILLKEGFTISGSDAKESPLTKHLEEKGAQLFYGQRASNIIDGIDLVVYTAAIHPDNPEYACAVEKGLPMMSRADLLGQMMKNYSMPIAVSGTHGKTTTTSMASQMLLEGGFDPTITVGGILPSIGGNLRLGHSGTFITEACEYTNSFLSFFPKISIILNMDADHLDFFKDIDDIRHSFRLFAEKLPADGTLIINADTPCWEDVARDLPCQVITYGLEHPADYTAADITWDSLGHPTFTCLAGGKSLGSFSLKVPGLHNVSNALSVIALGQKLGMETDAIRRGILDFTGTDRRFQYKGKVGDVTVIDDYAHHPTELAATMKTAKGLGYNRVIAVHQPFTYSRTKMLMDDFADVLRLADQVVLLPVMGGREADDGSVKSEQLAAKIPGSVVVDGLEGAANWVKQNAGEGDLVVCMSCGDLYKAADMMVGQ